jgi:hypothetical protein
MTTKAQLTQLAERVMGLSGPDRGVDALIAKALSLPWDYAADWGPRGFQEPVAFPYTASLDAAKSLVPEGFEFTVSLHIGGTGAASIFRRNDDNERETCCRLCVAATPALALTAAALLARAAECGE